MLSTRAADKLRREKPRMWLISGTRAPPPLPPRSRGRGHCNRIAPGLLVHDLEAAPPESWAARGARRAPGSRPACSCRQSPGHATPASSVAWREPRMTLQQLTQLCLVGIEQVRVPAACRLQFSATFPLSTLLAHRRQHPFHRAPRHAQFAGNFAVAIDPASQRCTMSWRKFFLHAFTSASSSPASSATLRLLDQPFQPRLQRQPITGPQFRTALLVQPRLHPAPS